MDGLRGIVCAAALLAAACYDSSFGEPEGGTAPEPVTTTVRELCDAFAGQTFAVTGEVVLAGVVSANERGGNFYRSLCIESDGAALEVMAGVDRLHNDFPVGCRVTLRLRGLAVGKSRGVLQVGRMPAPGSHYPTDYIGSKPALDRVLTRNGDPPHAPEPVVLTIPELTDARCGCLVRIENLRYSPETLTLSAWAGEKRFTDDAGHEIHTYVREYADFAAQEVPFGTGSITGILQRDDSGRFLVKPRDENDLPK